MEDQDPFSAIADKPSTDPFASIAETPKAVYTLPEGAGTAQAAPAKGHVKQFLDDLDADLRQGGTRTFLGRALGAAQGRGDKGYTGLESGGTKATADFMGSVPLGAVKTAQGIAEMHDHPVNGTLKTLSGVSQMAMIPSMVMGGPGASAAIEAVPSRKFAAELFKDVSENAGNVPVVLTKSGAELTRFKELADAGGTMPKAVTRLLSRARSSYTPGGKPLTYDEARDIYSNLSSLSAEDVSRLNPVMRRQMGIVTNALKDDIGDAAAQAGQAAKYYAAMKNYAQASKLLRAAKVIGKWAAAGTGAGAAYEGYDLLRKAAGK